MEAVVTTLIGLIGGFALSALLWYITVHLLAPRLEFGEDISKLYRSDGVPIYRVRISNVGRRPVVDVMVAIDLVYPNLPSDTVPSNVSTRIFSVDLGRVQYFFLRARKGNRVITLDSEPFLERMKDHHVIHSLYPVLEQRNAISLDDLLQRSAGAHLKVRVLCFDGWSGSRKYFESQSYPASSVKHGTFSGGKVIPVSSNPPTV